MKRRLRRLMGRAPGFSVDPATGEVAGVLRLDEAVEFGIATVGRHTYGTWDSPSIDVRPGEAPAVRIGAFCSFGPDVRLLTGGRHRLDWITTYPIRIKLGLPDAFNDGHPPPARPIVIGNDVWVATGATILDGVTVSDGAVIGANSMVTKDVRPYAIVVGNPGREVRRRFSDEEIEQLRDLQWWEWSDERIAENVNHLCSPDFDWLDGLAR